MTHLEFYHNTNYHPSSLLQNYSYNIHHLLRLELHNLTDQGVIEGKWELEIFKRITKINVQQWGLQMLQKQTVLVL